MMNFSKYCNFFKEHKDFGWVAIFIIVFLLVFGVLFKGPFIIPALSAFSGAFAAFMLNHVMKIIRDHHMEKTTLYAYKFIIETINCNIEEMERVYSNTKKGVVFTGCVIPKIIESDVMYLLTKGAEGEGLLKKILQAKLGYEQVSTAINDRNKLLTKVQALSDIEQYILKNTTEKLDDEFKKLPNELKGYINSIGKYIKDYYS